MVPRFFGSQFWSSRVLRFKICEILELQGNKIALLEVPFLGLGKNGAPTPTQRLKPNCMALGSKTLNCKVFAAATHL